MSVTEAVVETLTAEVRVLMVGNRQVTMSVVNQLDQVPLDEIQPFGRVRLRDGEVAVIGASAVGTLVIARIKDGHAAPISDAFGDDGQLKPGWQLIAGSSYARRKYPAEIISAMKELPLIILAGLR